MKTIVSVCCALLLLSFYSCGEAELPPRKGAVVSVSADWEDHAFHFMAKADILGDVEIEERGFVFTSPEIHNGEWVDWGKEVHTFAIPEKAPFEYTYAGYWVAGLSCNVYAYIKTKNGNYRSDYLELRTGDHPTVEVTGVRNVPDGQGIWHGGGTLYIEGKGFPSNKELVKVLVSTEFSDEGHYTALDIISASSEQIVAVYPPHYWYIRGEYPISLAVAGDKHLLEQKFIVEGAMIVGYEPAYPRHGETVTLLLDDFLADDPFTLDPLISVEHKKDVKITEVADNRITVYIPPVPINQLTFFFTDKYGIQAPPVTIPIAPSWQDADLPYQGYFSAVNVDYCLLQNKAYFYNYQKRTVLCFDTQSQSFSSFPMVDYPNNEYNANIRFFGWGDYLYAAIAVCRLGDGIVDFRRWQYMYRYNLKTEGWERLNDVDEEILLLDYASFGPCWDDGIVYSMDGDRNNLMEYLPETDTWQQSSLSGVGVLLGTENGYLYYLRNWDICRLRTRQDGGKEEVIHSYTDPVSGEFLIKDSYLYYRRGYGIYRKTLESPFHEEFLGMPFNVYNEWGYGYIIPAESELFYLWKNQDGCVLKSYLK